MNRPLQIGCCLLLLLLSPAPILTAAPAYQGPARVEPVYLNCYVTPANSKPEVLVIINSSGKTIPEGYKIYWSINSTTKGEILLSNDLPAGLGRPVNQLNFSGSEVKPKAWYYPALRRKVHIPDPVYLNCTWNGPKDFVVITIRNNTGKYIHKSKGIIWSINAQTHGSISLQNHFGPGDVITRTVELHGTAPYNPRAWYYE